MSAASVAVVLNLPVPDDLAELDQWQFWRYETRDSKPTKVPYSVRSYMASSTNPHDWATLHFPRQEKP